jgi:hypothetical protein
MQKTILFSLAFLVFAQQGEARAQQPNGGGAKNEELAMALGIGATVLPFLRLGTEESGTISTLRGALFLMGPAAGLFYAKAYRRGLVGVGLRTASVLVLASTITLFEDGDDLDTGLAIVGGLVLLGTYIADFQAIRPAVRKHNEGLSVTPTIEPGGGLGVRVRFRWPSR